MVPWATQDVKLRYDYLSPAGTTEIRLLPNLPRGEIVHATTPRIVSQHQPRLTESRSFSSSLMAMPSCGVPTITSMRSLSSFRDGVLRCRKAHCISTEPVASISRSS
jgi:hypothetical protein